MKIVSIDVGIKNLALCLFEVENKECYEIRNWDVVSLCNEIVVKCSCGKLTKYCYESREQNSQLYELVLTFLLYQ